MNQHWVSTASEVAPMQLFENAEGEGDAPYLDWTVAHPGGFVLQTSRDRPPSYMRLHRATCKKVTVPQSNYGPDPFTAGRYIKVCSEEPAEIWGFCQRHGRSDPPEPCTNCNPQPGYGDLVSLETIAKLARTGEAPSPARRTATVSVFERNPHVALFAKQAAAGICSLCEEPAPFEAADGPFLECHHIDFLSAGGADTLENVIGLCPNCHRRMHILAVAEDVTKLKQIARQRARERR